MERLQNVTLEEAYKIVKQNSFVLWTVRGNYMNLDISIDEENIQTRIFLGDSIFIVALSVENDGYEAIASRADFIDIWPFMKIKYPLLFEESVRGELYVIP